MTWLFEHLQDLLACFGALVGFCSLVVKLTPTQKDDNFVAWLVKVFNWLSIFNSKKDEETLEKAAKKAK